MKPKIKPKYAQGYADCFGKIHTTYEEAEKVNLNFSLFLSSKMETK